MKKETMMRSQTKNQVAYLSALTLLFSYIEMILPRTVPFFRLGLGNIAVLMAFNLPLAPFLLLSLIKATAASLMAGTLFSPFYLISLAQSFSSAVVMYMIAGINKKCGEKLFSVYGISVLGATISAVVQILLCSLYLGTGTFALLGAMLIFNTASGILTAFFCTKLENSGFDFSPEIQKTEAELSSKSSSKNPLLQIFFAIAILSSAASIFFIKSIPVLALAFCLSLIAQRLCKRKILILPHISLWIFVLISTILVPEGKVLVKLWNISITQGAILSGIQKSLRLSAVSALSQCAVILQPPKNSILALSLLYYKNMSDKFRSTKGNLFQRIKSTLA